MTTIAYLLVCILLHCTAYTCVWYAKIKTSFYSTKNKETQPGITILNAEGKQLNLFDRESEKVVNTFFQQTAIGCKKRINVVKEITHYKFTMFK